MSRAISDLRSFATATLVVVTSLALTIPAISQPKDQPPQPPVVSGYEGETFLCTEPEVAARPICREWLKAVDTWKNREKATGTKTIARAAAGQEWVTVSSDSTGVEKQIINDLILQINNRLKEGVPYAPQGQLTEIVQESRGRAANIKGAYQSLKTQKSIAACINWKASRLGKIAARSVGVSFRSTHLDRAIHSAMFQCERFKAKRNTSDCDCKVIAKNDIFEFEVPWSFLSRLANHNIDQDNAIPFIGTKGKEVYALFLGVKANKVFAISPDGAWGARWNLWLPIEELKLQALKECQKRASKPCVLYAVNDAVVWKGE